MIQNCHTNKKMTRHQLLPPFFLHLLQTAEGLIRLHRESMSRHDTLILPMSDGHESAAAE